MTGPRRRRRAAFVIVHGRGSFVADSLPQETKVMGGETTDARRAEALEHLA